MPDHCGYFAVAGITRQDRFDSDAIAISASFVTLTFMSTIALLTGEEENCRFSVRRSLPSLSDRQSPVFVSIFCRH